MGWFLFSLLSRSGNCILCIIGIMKIIHTRKTMIDRRNKRLNGIILTTYYNIRPDMTKIVYAPGVILIIMTPVPIYIGYIE